jgi:carnitine 3-dehydrogenase
MSLNQPVRRIAIVGTGVIGASWAAYDLARGIDVVATDPGPQAEANLRKYVDDAWPLLAEVGLSPGASRDRLTFSPDMSRALAQADWVQENAPERPDFKIKLFAQMDEATPPNSIIASSSSGITMDVIFLDLGAGRVLSANPDGSDQKTLLFAEGNLTGIAYVELPAAETAIRPV